MHSKGCRVTPFGGVADHISPKEFLKEYERYAIEHDWSEATMVKNFEVYLIADSVAEAWWNALDAKHKDAESVKWDDVKRAFTSAFPRPARVEPKRTELEMEIPEMRTADNDVGVKDKNNRGYLKHHVSASVLPRGAHARIADTSPGIIAIHAKPLRIFRRWLRLEAVNQNRESFTNAIKGVDVPEIQEDSERGDANERQEKLQRVARAFGFDRL